MAKIHWAAGSRETLCGLIYPVKNVGLTVHAQEVTCLRCQKAMPEVSRTRWDILNSEDGEVPKQVRKPRKRRPKPVKALVRDEAPKAPQAVIWESPRVQAQERERLGVEGYRIRLWPLVLAFAVVITFGVYRWLN